MWFLLFQLFDYANDLFFVGDIVVNASYNIYVYKYIYIYSIYIIYIFVYIIIYYIYTCCVIMCDCVRVENVDISFNVDTFSFVPFAFLP